MLWDGGMGGWGDGVNCLFNDERCISQLWGLGG